MTTYKKAKLWNQTVEQTNWNTCRVSKRNKQNANLKVYTKLFIHLLQNCKKCRIRTFKDLLTFLCFDYRDDLLKILHPCFFVWLELIRFLNCYRNHHPKFEIYKILTCLYWGNKLTLTNGHTDRRAEPNYEKF